MHPATVRIRSLCEHERCTADSEPVKLRLSQTKGSASFSEAVDEAERVNDFVAPGDVNLVFDRRVHWSAFSPRVAG